MSLHWNPPGQSHIRSDIRCKQREAHSARYAWPIRSLWHCRSYNPSQAALNVIQYQLSGTEVVYIIFIWTIPVGLLCIPQTGKTSSLTLVRCGAPPTNSSSIQARLSFFGVPLHDAKTSLATLQSISPTETSAQSKVVRNLGVLIFSQLSFSQHVNSITSKSYSELRCLKSFQQSPPLHAARMLRVSRIDYCNCLLSGAPAKITDKLQSVMNAAAKIVCGLKRYDHITQHMRDTFHWLPVPQRVTYKLCLLTYKTVHSKAPEYLIELCKPVAESESKCRLRSASTGDLLVPRTTTSFADRAFACVGPRAWNNLPLELRKTKTLDTLKKHLKTFVFKQAYGPSFTYFIMFILFHIPF